MGSCGNCLLDSLKIASPDINIINCDMAIKHEGKMMTKTNHRIFAAALGAHQQLSRLSLASRADGHGHEYLEFSFGHLDYENWLVVGT